MNYFARLVAVAVFTILASAFSQLAEAQVTWTYDIPGDGSPANSTPDQRMEAVANLIGNNGSIPYTSVGDAIVINWTAGVTRYRSVFKVTAVNPIGLSEVIPPFALSDIIYVRDGSTQRCQGQGTLTIEGYYQSWDITSNGEVINSGTDFIATGFSYRTGLCSVNFVKTRP
jgi:hypothetical protein